VSPALLIGLILGALLIGVPSARYARLQRAKTDWDGATRLHRSARAAFFRALGAFMRAAVGPVLVGAILLGLYLLGRRHR
jgi:hypothetical protein